MVTFRDGLERDRMNFHDERQIPRGALGKLRKEFK